MIPHHQVAIDISMLLQKKTQNPRMQEIIRQLIWIQNYEIHLMQNILQNSIINDSNDGHKNYTITVAALTKPNKIGLT